MIARIKQNYHCKVDLPYRYDLPTEQQLNLSPPPTKYLEQNYKNGKPTKEWICAELRRVLVQWLRLQLEWRFQHRIAATPLWRHNSGTHQIWMTAAKRYKTKKTGVVLVWPALTKAMVREKSRWPGRTRSKRILAVRLQEQIDISNPRGGRSLSSGSKAQAWFCKARLSFFLGL